MIIFLIEYLKSIIPIRIIWPGSYKYPDTVSPYQGNHTSLQTNVGRFSDQIVAAEVEDDGLDSYERSCLLSIYSFMKTYLYNLYLPK